ncbi:DUF3024 domain-containing protein [Mycobacterium servetii]|uniref:DUF3024 domain-containing protein n=1 Tax=Mycobacterium servetii TaxID=3237418 RepID=A0ABV4C9L7_9MYCO
MDRSSRITREDSHPWVISHPDLCGEVRRKPRPVGVVPQIDIARVQRWCRDRLPAFALAEVRVEVDVAERHLTVVECRSPWRPEIGAQWTRFPIARLRYVKSTGLWSLYWRDRNLRFHAYAGR